MTIPPYLHRITIPTPFPVGPVNAYLAEGDPLTLVDTGPKAEVSLAGLQAGLARHGCRLEDVGRVVVTHHHVDHMGLAAEIVRRSGAEVVTHPYNVPWLADYGLERLRQRPFYQRIWEEGGVPAQIVTAMEAASASITRWTEPAATSGRLAEGARLLLGADEWQVFHTPGHAGGLICLWEPRTRTLLANDHFIRDISSNPVLEPSPLMNGPRPRRLVEYLHHMDRMAALGPIVALAGHGEPVTDIAALVRQRHAFHERRAARLLDALDGQALTLWELTQPLFPRLTRGMDFFLALSEVLGHLDLLEAAGRAEPRPHAALRRWTRLAADLGYTASHDDAARIA
jgi:glyoxylase-like metal-dependent hydrolase (beta-lactamase superfamily II)